MLLLGAYLGFAFSRRCLPPARIFLFALVVSNSLAIVIAMGFAKGLTLEAIAGASLVIGFLGSWILAGRFGQEQP